MDRIVAEFQFLAFIYTEYLHWFIYDQQIKRYCEWKDMTLLAYEVVKETKIVLVKNKRVI